jgi:hypothetical protein
MSQGQSGYGPPGSRFPNCIFVHQVKTSPVGTEIILILDDQEWCRRLMVSYPPDDSEWRDKFLQVAESGPPVVRSCTIIAPPGQSIVALRPLDERGEPITQLCCIYRIEHGDWLSDQLAREQLAEFRKPLVSSDARDEQEEMNRRLYIEGDAYNCCLCGGVVSENNGYHFRQLSNDQVRALRLMSSVAKEFPFVCAVCYHSKMTSTKTAIGSAAGFQGWVMRFGRVVLRGYIMAMIGFNFFGVKNNHTNAILAWAFAGSFVSFESVPALILTIFRNPLVMMITFLTPVGLMAVFFTNPQLGNQYLLHPLAFLGPEFRFWSFDILKISILGSLVGFLVGGLLGNLNQNKDEAQTEEEVFRSPLS